MSYPRFFVLDGNGVSPDGSKDVVCFCLITANGPTKIYYSNSSSGIYKQWQIDNFINSVKGKLIKEISPEEVALLI